MKIKIATNMIDDNGDLEEQLLTPGVFQHIQKAYDDNRRDLYLDIFRVLRSKLTDIQADQMTPAIKTSKLDHLRTGEIAVLIKQMQRMILEKCETIRL